MENIALLAGYGRKDITPNQPVHIAGGNWRGRVSEGVLDPLYATCIALKMGEATFLLYTLDLKVTTKNITNPARAYISKVTGVPEENVLLSATHTHSSVATRYTWDGVEEYKNFFYEACAEAAKEAIGDLQASDLFVGSTQTEGLTFVRHYLMNDGTVSGSAFGDTSSGYKRHMRPSDGELQLVSLRRDGKKDILLLSFPCHGTFQGNAKVLSADWVGPARAHIEANSDTLVAIFQGASGDQTPGSRIPDLAIKDYNLHGQKLGDYAMAALSGLKKITPTQLQQKRRNIIFPVNKKNMDKLPIAKEVMELIAKYGPTSQEVKEKMAGSGLASRYEANWLITRSREGDETDLEPAILHLGSMAFVLAPYEMFSEQGKYIKEHCPLEQAFIVTCFDGSFNYIASKECFDYDCYESQCCFFARGTAEELADIYVDMMQE